MTPPVLTGFGNEEIQPLMTLVHFTGLAEVIRRMSHAPQAKKSLIFRVCNSGHIFVNQMLQTRHVCA